MLLLSLNVQFTDLIMKKIILAMSKLLSLFWALKNYEKMKPWSYLLALFRLLKHEKIAKYACLFQTR